MVEAGSVSTGVGMRKQGNHVLTGGGLYTLKRDPGATTVQRSSSRTQWSVFRGYVSHTQSLDSIRVIYIVLVS
jgi:hypothetical protein